MGAELLIEIGVEEIPARFCPQTLEQMHSSMEAILAFHRIAHGAIKTMCTPRRLVIGVNDVAAQQSMRVIKLVGPPKRISFDSEGKPTKAAIGFARSQSVTVDDLRVEDIPEKGGEYLYLEKEDKGTETSQLLPSLIPEWIIRLGFPKSMRWGNGELRFARPIHWILALSGDNEVSFEVDGIKSGATTYGHRFIHPEPIQVKNFRSYTELLEKACVLCDHEKRKEIILKDARREAEHAGGTLRENAELLEEVTHLVEWPVALCGSFDPAFLALPEEVLIASMRDHQKYFCVVDNHNKLLPRFITICNIPADDSQVIIKGNERVLKARLSDAAFFLKEDTKSPFSERVESLKGVIFQEKLGSLYDKTVRIEELSRYLAENLRSPLSDIQMESLAENFCSILSGQTGEMPGLQKGESSSLSLKTPGSVFQTGSQGDIISRVERAAILAQRGIVNQLRDRLIIVERAALLSKCDLVTEMVKEFPELQGVMGREYAIRSGERLEVGQAIYEHYLPRFSGDALPESLAGALLSLADKIDTIAGCFSLGLIPTGSEDPHAMRRQTQGMIQIILDKGLLFPWDGFIQKAISLLPSSGSTPGEEIETMLTSFINQRINNYFLSQGFEYDLINAVMGGDGDSHPLSIQKRLAALKKFRSDQVFESILTPFKRVINILPKNTEADPKVNPKILVEEGEKRLYARFKKLRNNLNHAIKKGEYLEALQTMVSLKEPIDMFFDQVLVMDKDEALRKNRLALLSSIGRIFLKIADFSKIVQE